MPGEGIVSVFSAAMGYVPTLFSYFNPRQSPYYSMTVACIVGIGWFFFSPHAAWIAAFVPLALVLGVLAAGVLSSPRFEFTIDEYNDQLKFARGLAVTTASICIVFLSYNKYSFLGYDSVVDPGAGGGADNHVWGWPILFVYTCCLVQIGLFLAYHFVFKGYEEQVRTERNYVQIALVMCAYLAGMTWVVDRSPQLDESHGIFPLAWMTLVLFASIWLTSASIVFLFVRRNFALQPPVAPVQSLKPSGTNVVTFRQVEVAAADLQGGQTG
jgi:hypothetical protein